VDAWDLSEGGRFVSNALSRATQRNRTILSGTKRPGSGSTKTRYLCFEDFHARNCLFARRDSSQWGRGIAESARPAAIVVDSTSYGLARRAFASACSPVAIPSFSSSRRQFCASESAC
jgi:hypothetical protein